MGILKKEGEDLACGKGRHSIFLNKKGIKVTGVDLSEQSILEAQKSENNRLSFFTHDMRIPAWKNHFDFVLNLFTSFGYFENEQDNYKTIANISDALKPNGILVLDFMNATKVVNNLVPKESKTIDGITFNLKRTVIKGFITKTIQFEDAGKQFEYQEKVQALKLADFEKYFKAANLKIVDIFGNYNLDDFDEQNSDRLILIAKKT